MRPSGQWEAANRAARERALIASQASAVIEIAIMTVNRPMAALPVADERAVGTGSNTGAATQRPCACAARGLLTRIRLTVFGLDGSNYPVDALDCVLRTFSELCPSSTTICAKTSACWHIAARSLIND